MAPVPALLRKLPLLRTRLQRYDHSFTAAVFASLQRTICSSNSYSYSYCPDSFTEGRGMKELPDFYSKMEDYFYWKDNKHKIRSDISPTWRTAKRILRSNRYKDGERLTVDDEKFVLEKLLAYHPQSVDKIGCGVDSILVDRHTEFKKSRCLFVVRTDGNLIDFSYQKCLQEYIRRTYPLIAEKFIEEHFQHRSIHSAGKDN